MQLVELAEHPMMPIVFRPALDKVIETISELTESPHWIPCKPIHDNFIPDSRLVNDVTKILVTYKTGRLLRSYVKQVLCDHGRVEKKVPGIITAWMELPAPYEEE